MTAYAPGSTRRTDQTGNAAVDYTSWSIEELRDFAIQMRLRGAEQMSRLELIELFAPRSTGIS